MRRDAGDDEHRQSSQADGGEHTVVDSTTFSTANKAVDIGAQIDQFAAQLPLSHELFNGQLVLEPLADRPVPSVVFRSPSDLLLYTSYRHVVIPQPLNRRRASAPASGTPRVSAP